MKAKHNSLWLRGQAVVAFCLSIITAVAFVGCGGGGGPFTPSNGGGGQPTPSISFRNDIQPIFNQRCMPCHDSTNKRGGLDLSEGAAYDNLVNKPSAQNTDYKRVIPGNADQSLLYLKISQENPPVGNRMPPPPRDPLSQEEQKKIMDWINQGAANN